jgi:hypothetical protein
MRCYESLRLFCCLIVLWGTSSVCEAGTLIVSYKIEAGGERLERVRFFLKDSRESQQMFPKGGDYIDDPIASIRIVVIDTLPVGDYLLQFVIPNTDGLFEECPIRSIHLEEDSVIKVDQLIRLHSL